MIKCSQRTGSYPSKAPSKPAPAKSSRQEAQGEPPARPQRQRNYPRRQPTNQRHFSHVAFHKLSARSHRQHVTSSGTTINSVALIRISVSNQREIVPLQMSGKRMDGQVWFQISADVKERSKSRCVSTLMEMMPLFTFNVRSRTIMWFTFL